MSPVWIEILVVAVVVVIVVHPDTLREWARWLRNLGR